MLIRQAFTGLRALLVFTLLLGLAYPLAMVLIAKVVPSQDSAIRNADGVVVGSALMAQPVTGDDWFYPRPSAGDYDGLSSGGSNLAATNPELVTAITTRRAEIAEREASMRPRSPRMRSPPRRPVSIRKSVLSMLDCRSLGSPRRPG